MKSKRRMRLGAAGLSLALFASACGTATTEEVAAGSGDAEAAVVEETEAESTGGPGLPRLVADTVGGAQLDTNDLAGQDTVIWFWAPW